MANRNIQNDVNQGIAVASGTTVTYTNQAIDLAVGRFDFSDSFNTYQTYVFEGCDFTCTGGTNLSTLFIAWKCAGINIQFKNCTFSNISVATGAATFLLLGTTDSVKTDCYGDVTIEGCTFTNFRSANSSSGSGGSTHFINLSGSKTNSTSNLTIKNTTFSGMTYTSSDFIYASNANSLKRNNVVFEDSSVNSGVFTVDTASSCTFKGNVSLGSGLLSNNSTNYTAADGTVLTLNGTTFRDGSTINVEGTLTLVHKVDSSRNGLTFTGIGKVYYMCAGHNPTATPLAGQILYNRIYGDEIYTESADAKATGFTITGGTMTSAGSAYSRIYGGASVTAENVKLTGGNTINLNLNFAAGSVVGNVYGGGMLSQTGCTYNIGAINTIISGDGYFKYYVGNGTQANSNCSVTQGDSMLTITGGTFASFVYAGGYSQANATNAASIMTGNTNLNITGGTFLSNVFGGCVAAGDIAYSQYTTVDGNSSVTVTGENSTITFARNLIAGSNGRGIVTGDTTVTFKGDGSKIKFTGTNANYGYVAGGCTADYINRNGEAISFVTGNRNLAFDMFNGNFEGNIRNTFDTVSFHNSAVTFAGSKEVDLKSVSTWEFDATHDNQLNWVAGTATTKNDFAEDAFVINGTLSKAVILMTGDETTLNGWQDIASLTYNDGPELKGVYDRTKNWVNFDNQYTISVVEGTQLTLATYTA